MDRLRIAIIGQGRSGRDIHGAYLHTDEAKKLFEVAAIVDEIEERRERARKEWPGIPVFSSYQALLDRKDQIDLVVNSTYSYQHAAITIDLLRHGFHVLTEKPACRNVKEFDEMVSEAEKAERFLGIFQQSRYAPYYRQVKKVLQSGVLGRIIDVDIRFNSFARRWDWQTLLSFNGGSLRNTGPHPLDQALDILDAPDQMPQIFCRMDRVNTFGDAEDYVKLILTMPDKPLIDLTISCCDAYPVYTYKIHGSNGGLKGTMSHIDWKYFDPQSAPVQSLRRGAICEPDGTPAYCHEKLEWIEDSWDGDGNGAFDAAVQTYYEQMWRQIKEGVPMEVTLPQVRQQVAVYEEAHRQNQDRLTPLA
ncbi:MAG: Gfo/Idh/MocA family oxidoreductase [Firmicutes bacterium]|nr:Gfo/Idh/MocA family oxidoreductase [Bacillota bacterium]